MIGFIFLLFFGLKMLHVTIEDMYTCIKSMTSNKVITLHTLTPSSSRSFRGEEEAKYSTVVLYVRRLDQPTVKPTNIHLDDDGSRGGKKRRRRTKNTSRQFITVTDQPNETTTINGHRHQGRTFCTFLHTVLHNVSPCFTSDIVRLFYRRIWYVSTYCASPCVTRSPEKNFLSPD